MTADNITMLGATVGQDVLDKIVSELVTGNCTRVSGDNRGRHDPTLTVNKRHAGTVLTTFADTIQITIQELATANLQTFLDHLRGILVHAVLGGETKNVVSSSATISRSSVFADVLNAPVPELAMSYDIDTSKDLVDTRTLLNISI
jgi:hypothetical protein